MIFKKLDDFDYKTRNYYESNLESIKKIAEAFKYKKVMDDSRNPNEMKQHGKRL